MSWPFSRPTFASTLVIARKSDKSPFHLAFKGTIVIVSKAIPYGI